MQNIKQFFTYVVVGALVIALSISCKNDDKTGSGNGGNVEADNGGNVEADTGGGTRTLSYYAGDWWGNPPGQGEKHMFTINADGSVTIKTDADSVTYPSTDITKNSDTSYTYYSATDDASMYFDFTSDTKGTISMDGSTAINVTKK